MYVLGYVLDSECLLPSPIYILHYCNHDPRVKSSGLRLYTDQDSRMEDGVAIVKVVEMAPCVVRMSSLREKTKTSMTPSKVIIYLKV